jgi:hypothetical protein
MRLQLVVAPCEMTGWRSEALLITGRGAPIRIELISGITGDFPTCDGADSQVGGMPMLPAGIEAHRARALAGVGEADRRIATRARDARNGKRLCSALLQGPAGGVDLARLAARLEKEERACLAPQYAEAFPFACRLHSFAENRRQDNAVLTVAREPGSPGLFRTHAVRSCLSHGPSGTVIAVSESLYRVMA